MGDCYPFGFGIMRPDCTLYQSPGAAGPECYQSLAEAVAMLHPRRDEQVVELCWRAVPQTKANAEKRAAVSLDVLNV